MAKRRSDREALERAANAATAAGMSYGKYQQHIFAQNNRIDKSGLYDRQPIYEKALESYICPQCAHPVVPHKNCGHCGKALIWKVGVKA